MIIKGKFEGQLEVTLEFSARTQSYRVWVSEWRKARSGPAWYVPGMHLWYDDWKGFENSRVFSGRRARTKALRYYAKAKAEQAYRHAAHIEVGAAQDDYKEVAR